MAIFIKAEDQELIQKAGKFCEKIRRHLPALDLNRGMVEIFKNENELFMHVYANEGQYKTCSQSFIEIKLDWLRTLYAEVVSACKSSPGYTFKIGQELGLEGYARPLESDHPAPEMAGQLPSNGHSMRTNDPGNLSLAETLRELRNHNGFGSQQVGDFQ